MWFIFRRVHGRVLTTWHCIPNRYSLPCAPPHCRSQLQYVILTFIFVDRGGGHKKHGQIGDFVVKAPMVLGHESAGIVVACGANVKGLKKGSVTPLVFSVDRNHIGKSQGS
jgi:Alcohol dehydrogenase GroES-like domain